MFEMPKVILYGKSGAGKTTILETLLGRNIIDGFSAGQEFAIVPLGNTNLLQITILPGQDRYRRPILESILNKNIYVVLVVNSLNINERKDLFERVESCYSELRRYPIAIIATHKDLLDKKEKTIIETLGDAIGRYGIKKYYLVVSFDRKEIFDVFEEIYSLISSKKPL